MTFRITIPRLVDIAIIDDLAAMRWLNRHPDVSRRLPPSRYWLHELIRTRIERDLRVSGGPLPIFLAREEVVRRDRQVRLEERLRSLDPGDPAHADGVAALARYIAGDAPAREGAVLVQQMVGRWFSPRYAASAATVRAARTLESWPRRDPITAAFLRLSGALACAKEKLASGVERDPSGIHATSLALFNLVEAVGNLRGREAGAGMNGAAADGRAGAVVAAGAERDVDADAARAVAASLVAPRMVFRACLRDIDVDFVRGPLREGTLVLFLLRRIQRRASSAEPIFHAEEWSRCPAHAIIPRFLEAIWREHVRLRPGGTSAAEPAAKQAKRAGASS